MKERRQSMQGWECTKGRAGGGPGQGDAAPAKHTEKQPGLPSSARTPASGFWSGDAASRPKISGDQREKLAFLDVLDEIDRHGDGLRKSPQLELNAFMGALRGEYVPPSSGGDPLINPESVPTGRNLCSLARNIRRRKKRGAWADGWPTSFSLSTKRTRAIIRTGSPLRSGAASSSAGRARPSPRFFS